MNYSKLKLNDIANGPGLRTTLFVSGCTHRCKGCFQPETWNFDKGLLFTFNLINVIIESSRSKYIKGLSLLGGDPLDNVEGILPLVKAFKKELPNKTIWLWTGYKFEDIIKDPAKYKVLEYIDVIIDGRFEEDLKDITLKYCGSSNQKVIDVKKSLLKNEVVLYSET